MKNFLIALVGVFGTVLLGIGTVILGLVISLWFFSTFLNWFPSPELGKAGFRGDTYQWNGGTVGVCDYSTYPGGYWNRVEWHNANRDFRILAEPGNTIPKIEINDSNELTITYRETSHRFRTGFDVTATFKPDDADQPNQD